MKIKISESKAREYFKKNGLIKNLQGGAKDQLKANYCDLARLHSLVVQRKAFTILEFGVGWSTIVLADALRLNKQKWDKLKKKPDIINSDNFKIFSVDSSKKWIKVVNNLIPLQLKRHIEIFYSDVEASLFDGRMCHFYSKLPDIVPDFIYLDGPDPATVKGGIKGMTWKNRDRTVMSGDMLYLEPILLPGVFLIIDGRTNNARFLANNLQRKWKIKHYPPADVTTMELRESPLGKKNKARIFYCLNK